MNKFLVTFCAFAALGIASGNFYQQQNALKRVEEFRGITVNVTTEDVQERIINLPEDGNIFYTSLFLPTNWEADAKSRTLKAWFDTQYQLSSLRAQTHWNVITPADPQWNYKYSKSVTVLPCVCLTTADGSVFYKASGETIPTSPSKLATAIDQSIEKRCPNRRCPWKNDEEKPEPTPPAVPDTAPPDTSPPDITPEPMRDDFPLWLGLLVGMAGAGLAIGPDLVKKWKSMG